MTEKSHLITHTDQLIAWIESIKGCDFIAVDTEFMRESTYFSQLCLIQLCAADKAVALDPLAETLELAPLWQLLDDQSLTKVFHAGRQDLEIFYNLGGRLPTPLYDTQIGAMVCGLGDQVGYEKLVQDFLGLELDKSSRFTDWSQRPLSERQLRYALDDVIYLHQIYPMMEERLVEQGRQDWPAEEMHQLTNPDLYRQDPQTAWQRLKIRSNKPAMLNRLQELASWRETEAIRRNMPRGRILRDETLLDLAGSAPQSTAELKKIRGFPGGANGAFAAPVIEVLQKADNRPKHQWPKADARPRREKPPAAVMDLLRVLLKYVTDKHQVAPRLIATAEELELLALSDTPEVRALSGWRHDLFGVLALKVKHGELALAVRQGQIELIERSPPTS
ncbi:MAG: ribonuclease D [Alphaproteobacteria bacterium]|jgi:ribonuclease D|nr:ribonuclease D [Alphaproteobacteria bacterium]